MKLRPVVTDEELPSPRHWRSFPMVWVKLVNGDGKAILGGRTKKMRCDEWRGKTLASRNQRCHETKPSNQERKVGGDMRLNWTSSEQ
ncbi:hypothetical protein E3N88_35797 [Mikania micrantha]|uniref:Uncharacterized protein n=1 Tax=Mikania micrantha TaxID=192012 RepID=A0A5N6M221_9ASTR|nr:hypothetical protein E3N88_35797 [Mikania micrantha]